METIKTSRWNNRAGLRYIIEGNNEQTTISIPSEGKAITVNRGVFIILRSWAIWVETNELVQEAFPYMTPSEREFLISGTTGEEWEEMFGEETLNEGEGTE